MSLSGWPDGAKIRRLREDKNLSVTQLAERVGIARQYLSLIELGVKKQPSIDTLAGIARELGESLGDLVVIAPADDTEDAA
jgi:XRE family transcriptional regulator, master regulator for biofilm formation